VTIATYTVSPREIVRAAGLDVDLPVYARAAVEGNELIGVGGLAWSVEPKRCWIWFHMVTPRPGADSARRVIREARRLMRHAVQLGETEVYSPRDPSFATSEKLMKLLNFQLYAVEDGKEIWVCRDLNS
jgi:hypothetical protein